VNKLRELASPRVSQSRSVSLSLLTNEIMSFDDSSWRTTEKRQVMVQKLAEAMQLYPNVLVLPHNDPIYVENSMFQKARTRVGTDTYITHIMSLHYSMITSTWLRRF
jgi:hypothetical protein